MLTFLLLFFFFNIKFFLCNIFKRKSKLDSKSKHVCALLILFVWLSDLTKKNLFYTIFCCVVVVFQRFLFYIKWQIKRQIYHTVCKREMFFSSLCCVQFGKWNTSWEADLLLPVWLGCRAVVDIFKVTDLVRLVAIFCLHLLLQMKNKILQRAVMLFLILFEK